jgi:homoserine kinase
VKTHSTFNINLPATSANLGPAFDAAALALNLWLKVSAAKSREYSITATGQDPEICGRVENHLVLTTYQEILRAEKKPAPALSLKIQNGFPIGKGLGSSAAARLAGIALAVHFGRLAWNSRRIVGEAAQREHHPDNAAACWMGGMTVARMIVDGEAQVARFVPRGKWPLLLAIPGEALPTEQARSVLPEKYSRADAVTNIQNSMLLLAALYQGDREMLASALEDRIHQPYREKLCPLLAPLRDFPRGSPRGSARGSAKDRGVLGAVLSGAGPSVLMFLDPKAATEKVKAKVDARLRHDGLRAELVLTSIAKQGGEASFLRRSK